MTSTTAAAVQVTGLRKTFHVKGAPVTALTGIDLAVAPGEIFGLLGPNGAGKTTTLRILTTLLTADAGEALVARPSLDDVFLRETGRSLRDKGEETATPQTDEVAA